MFEFAHSETALLLAQAPAILQIIGWFVVGVLALVLFIFFITFGRL